MNIVVDLRENSLKELLPKEDFIQYTQLPLGDIVIKSGEEILYIIERKTLDDLNHSISDGRYHEQKHRLMEHFPCSNIIYLIEGTKCKGFYQGAITNTICRDNIKVIRSINTKESVSIIMDLYTKCLKGTFNKASVNTLHYSSLIKTEKKGKMNPKTWYIASLKNIPGVSD